VASRHAGCLATQGQTLVMAGQGLSPAANHTELKDTLSVTSQLVPRRLPYTT